MKQIFLQEEWGQCVYVCIANLFNNYKIISEKKDFSKGLNWIGTQKLIENYSDYTCKSIFETKKPYKGSFNFFEVDEYIDDINDYYIVFIASIEIKPKIGHAILIIKENNNNTLSVFDPVKKEPYNINQNVFFKDYNCISLQMICSKDGPEMFFYRSFLKHLIE